ncbi:PREDICTED: ras and EF-hand domain-containing protein homolog, partial [Poecilia mexicana]|uniref:ras and EF-hand domain-containing protein homolog n=1 Tax=Poecilia mexicana TaxID=48701 RepID=UPI00072D92E7
MSQSSKTSTSDSEEERVQQMLARERRKLHEIMEEVGRMSFENHALLKANEELKIQVMTLEQAAFEKDKLVREKDEEFKTLVDMNITLKEDYARLEMINRAMEKKNRDYDKEIAVLKQKFRALEQENINLTAKINTLEEKNTGLEEENSVLEQVNCLLETENRVNVKDVSDLREEKK